MSCSRFEMELLSLWYHIIRPVANSKWGFDGKMWYLARKRRAFRGWNARLVRKNGEKLQRALFLDGLCRALHQGGAVVDEAAVQLHQ